MSSLVNLHTCNGESLRVVTLNRAASQRKDKLGVESRGRKQQSLRKKEIRGAGADRTWGRISLDATDWESRQPWGHPRITASRHTHASMSGKLNNLCAITTRWTHHVSISELGQPLIHFNIIVRERFDRQSLCKFCHRIPLSMNNFAWQNRLYQLKTLLLKSLTHEEASWFFTDLKLKFPTIKKNIYLDPRLRVTSEILSFKSR